MGTSPESIFFKLNNGSNMHELHTFNIINQEFSFDSLVCNDVVILTDNNDNSRQFCWSGPYNFYYHAYLDPSNEPVFNSYTSKFGYFNNLEDVDTFQISYSQEKVL